MNKQNDRRSKEFSQLSHVEMEQVQGGESMSLNFEKYKTPKMQSYLTVKLENTLVSNWSTGGGY